jgi:excisionase family DNA binding protein
MTDKLLTVEEAADRRGTSGRFVRRLIAERRIAYVKVGRHVRIAEGRPGGLRGCWSRGGERVMAERRKRARSFGTARRLPSGRWQARYYDQAGVRHTAPQTFPSKADASRYLAQGEADLLRGAWTDPRLARITFGEWVERWWPTTADLRPGTRAFYDYLLRRLLLPAFEETPLGRIDAMTVRSWLAGLHEAGEVTPTTIANAYRLLRRILNVAVEAGYLPRNPAVIKGAGLERAAEMRHVSIPQLHALAEAVPGRYRALVLAAGYGGLRWGELVGLRRRRVDLAGARIHVARLPVSSSSRRPRRPPVTGWWCCRRSRSPRWRTTWTTTPLPSQTGSCSVAVGAPTCSGATLVGWCGARRCSSLAWTGSASTTCGTRPPPWRLQRERPPGS